MAIVTWVAMSALMDLTVEFTATVRQMMACTEYKVYGVN